MPAIVVLASLASLLATPTPVASRAAPRPTFAGSWVLNRAQSDDARAMMEERQRAAARARRSGMGVPDFSGGGMGGGGGGMGGGGMDGPPGVGMGGMMGSGVDRERGKNITESVTEPAQTFTVTQDDTSLVFDYGEGRSTLLITDGGMLTDNLKGIGFVDTRARWERQRLVVERRFDAGGRVVEEYSRSPESGQLVVAVEFATPRLGKLRFRRVYDPAPVSPPTE
jgi:hypothetical protein